MRRSMSVTASNDTTGASALCRVKQMPTAKPDQSIHGRRRPNGGPDMT
jgi:hypothetical protein